jgi:thiol-disulfide isomerase/thioredoxin
VRGRTRFALIGVAALLAGGVLWWMARGPAPAERVAISPGAVWAASFQDLSGKSRSLGEFRGRVVVLNFWATWCAPCRDEMPVFARLHGLWKERGVQFVGLANDEASRVERFGRELAIPYPLWTGGDAVGDLSRRMGNRLGVLPHTVILGVDGQVLDVRVGPYTEAQLSEKLASITGN